MQKRNEDLEQKLMRETENVLKLRKIIMDYEQIMISKEALGRS
jgi:hypothetical protein